MNLIDTHTHLYVEDFDHDRSEVIDRALEAGITHFYLPAIDSTYTQRMFALEKAYPEQVRLMMGVHPTHIKENYQDELAQVKSHLNQRDFAAVGEIGIELEIYGLPDPATHPNIHLIVIPEPCALAILALGSFGVFRRQKR